ncbi:MAG: hypothetical protein CMJ94_01440 [Planctomycetes bacterium]|nr:hypothetical protein [Planctomycetota bacterium]
MNTKLPLIDRRHALTAMGGALAAPLAWAGMPRAPRAQGLDLVFVQSSELSQADQLAFFFDSATQLGASRGARAVHQRGARARLLTVDESGRSLGSFLNCAVGLPAWCEGRLADAGDPAIGQAEVVQWVFAEEQAQQQRSMLRERARTRRVIVAAAPRIARAWGCALAAPEGATWLSFELGAATRPSAQRR